MSRGFAGGRGGGQPRTHPAAPSGHGPCGGVASPRRHASTVVQGGRWLAHPRAPWPPSRRHDAGRGPHYIRPHRCTNLPSIGTPLSRPQPPSAPAWQEGARRRQRLEATGREGLGQPAQQARPAEWLPLCAVKESCMPIPAVGNSTVDCVMRVSFQNLWERSGLKNTT